jgi:hypothetical protein
LGRALNKIVALLSTGRLVRFWHKADIEVLPINVRFRAKADIGAGLSLCPLMSHSGHTERHVVCFYSLTVRGKRRSKKKHRVWLI